MNIMKLGINGLGRIGKLLLWNHVARGHFNELVVNIGRDVGTSMNDLAASIERDSTYGRLTTYLNGFRGGRVIEELDEQTGRMQINGIPVTVQRTARNPKEVGWRDHDVNLVVDTTGAFRDPGSDADEPRGSLRGHIAAGASKVILSAPFKIKAKGLEMPDDAITTVMGINDDEFLPTVHSIVSAASCTTTCLSYMMKPLLERIGADNLLSASMVTVHAATGSQQVLDRLPGAGASDLRKNRSILNNIILTTTGAAKALGQVIPEMRNIGFIAESVRIPTATGSLIILVINIHDEPGLPTQRDYINSIYREYSRHNPYLVFSDEQNVSSDMIGYPKAATVIEGSETHTRTASIRVNIAKATNADISGDHDPIIEVPVTQAVIYGWYDNELGSYTHMLTDLTWKIAESMV
jgi:glyceraldehyde 3-phosphate dehydrogenase